MPKIHCVRSVPLVRSPRVKQLEGMFDVPPAERSARIWEVDLPLEERDWRIGLVVGPSGCGKTTLARELFPGAMIDGFVWPADRSIVDAFPAAMGIKDITGLLSSVGFSSPPNWLRPFAALSNGEQFRVTIARALAEQPDLAVIDEFTSVVDRTVARIGSAAVARTIRQSNRRLVAVTCHYDIIEWLDPDWIYDPATDEFQWRCLQRRNERREEASPAGSTGARHCAVAKRPAIGLEIARVHRDAWRLFKPHHYLSGELNRTAKCFMAFLVGGEGAPGDRQSVDSAGVSSTEYSVRSTQFSFRPAAFTAVLHAPDAKGGYWREHRTVCLPDFQGVGIGNALSEFVASLFVATGKRYCSRTSHPAMIRHRATSTLWRMGRGASFGSKQAGSCTAFNRSAALDRMTVGFRFVGPPNFEAARNFGIIPSRSDRAEGKRVS
ncbi:MAG TPA: ABC transporter ATP-binding protein [Planctomycetaceae bacterium]